MPVNVQVYAPCFVLKRILLLLFVYMGKYTATDRYVLLETSRQMPTLVELNKNLIFSRI